MAKNALAEIDMAAIAKIVATDTKIWAGLKKAGDMAVEHWQEESPVGQVEHTLKRGDYVVHPGDYQSRVREKFVRPKNVKDIAEAVSLYVYDWDFKAGWIEHGSEHNEAKAPCAKTRAYMISQGYLPL